jgi:hypothetical protein
MKILGEWFRDSIFNYQPVCGWQAGNNRTNSQEERGGMNRPAYRKQAQQLLIIRPMRTPEIKEFILQHSDLFWYIPPDKKADISDEVLIETILNYGDKDAFMQLFKLMGINNVAKLFFKSINTSERRKGNYSELTINYFTHVFSKYAH